LAAFTNDELKVNHCSKKSFILWKALRTYELKFDYFFQNYTTAKSILIKVDQRHITVLIVVRTPKILIDFSAGRRDEAAENIINANIIT